MEKTVKKLLVATGLIASAAVALLPLTSYARSISPTEITDDMSFGTSIDANGNVISALWSSPSSDYICDRWEPETTACARASQNGSTQVTVNVDTVLAIDAVSLTCSGENDTCVDVDADSKAIQAYPGLVRTGTLTTSIRSAKPFTVSISADEPYLMGYDSEGNNTGTIIPASNVLDGKNNGWGIQKFGETTYTALKSQPVVFFTSDVPYDTAADVNFKVGVSANSNIPQGMYSTEVTITAATIGTN